LLNYIINGQFYVVYRYLTSNEVITLDKLKDFLKEIEKNISIFKPLDVLIIGSFSRGKMSKTSDLDIRIYHKKDFISSIKAYIMATKLRFLGLIKQFPVDVYCFSDIKFMDKIRKDETPVNFLKNKDILKKYKNSPNIKEHMKRLEFK
jgi:predicted nucleotidyltransferase